MDNNFTTPSNPNPKKLGKKDIKLVLILAVLFTITVAVNIWLKIFSLDFYSYQDFEYPFFWRFAGFILGLSYLPLTPIYYILGILWMADIEIPSQLFLALDILAIISAFVLYFLIFFVFSKLTKLFFATKKIWQTNVIVIVISIIFFSSFIYYGTVILVHYTGRIISIEPSSVSIGDTVNVKLSSGYDKSIKTQAILVFDYDSKGVPKELVTLWYGFIPDNEIISIPILDEYEYIKIPLRNNEEREFIKIPPGSYNLRIIGCNKMSACVNFAKSEKKIEIVE